jgi:lipoate-protein ligase B
MKSNSIILLAYLIVTIREVHSFSKIINGFNFIEKPPVSYDVAKEWQQVLVEHHIHQRSTSSKVDCHGSVLILQHKSVYTAGSGTEDNSGPFDRHLDTSSRLVYDIVKTNRAGQLTYHGPGQIVMYPILDLVGSFTYSRTFIRCWIFFIFILFLFL